MTGVKLGDMHKLIPKGEGRGKDRAANGIYFLKQMSLIENNYVITHLCMLQFQCFMHFPETTVTSEHGPRLIQDSDLFMGKSETNQH